MSVTPTPKAPPSWRLALALPVCATLLLAGLTPGGLPKAHDQAGERIKAHELYGAVGQIGSDRPIRIVLLDFWTLC